MPSRIRHAAPLLVDDFGWAGWDFYPSQWNPGTLLINWRDNQWSEIVAIAAPGVSLCGEIGLETACWRQAAWEDANAFFDRGEPTRFGSYSLDSIAKEIPADFSDWVADATAAHIERLRAFFADRPDDLEASELADRLELELESTLPGARERLQSEAETAWGESSMAAPPLRAAFRRRLGAARVVDALGQLMLLGVVYGFYRLVRESWAPEGVHVGFGDVLMLPLGQFFLWLYGFAHLLLPLAFLGWLYVNRRPTFAFARNTILLTALLSIGGYLAYAPQPVYGIRATGSIPAGALATMPALHLAVALALAYLGAVMTRGLVAKIAWCSYPPFVLLVFFESDVRHLELTVALSLTVVTSTVLLSRYLLPRIPALDLGPWRYAKEVRARRDGKSGRRGSNPRPQAWEACALPTELRPRDS